MTAIGIGDQKSHHEDIKIKIISERWNKAHVPSILMYIQLIGRMAADPKGAAETAPVVFATVFTPSPPHATLGSGEKGKWRKRKRKEKG